MLKLIRQKSHKVKGGCGFRRHCNVSRKRNCLSCYRHSNNFPQKQDSRKAHNFFNIRTSLT
ncbi:hypothetical protein PDJAM_G00127540 [Pangasius djambal]|uniref:Uncharacterized protein n=1 Tax=Pangasius djambal TaxID=1691987 RepID=A0ACC5ZBE5_9TELE|nr:hypothetical protein [Pangasius djambal]